MYNGCRIAVVPVQKPASRERHTVKAIEVLWSFLRSDKTQKTDLKPGLKQEVKAVAPALTNTDARTTTALRTDSLRDTQDDR